METWQLHSKEEEFLWLQNISMLLLTLKALKVATLLVSVQTWTMIMHLYYILMVQHVHIGFPVTS